MEPLGIDHVLEGSPSLNALVDDRIKQHPHEPLFYIPDVGNTFEWQSLTWTDVDQCIRAATAYYAPHIGLRRRGLSYKTIAMYCANSFDYLVTSMALLRLGHHVGHLSPNNSVSAVVQLLKIINADTIVFSKNKNEQVRQVLLALQAGQEVPNVFSTCEEFIIENVLDIRALPPPPTESDPYRTDVEYIDQAHEPAFTLHSSGSTGFPKPITIT
jgi:acyl-CoA synthetase (AMP-forming)/AMP-acid ligase II